MDFFSVSGGGVMFANTYDLDVESGKTAFYMQKLLSDKDPYWANSFIDY